MKVCVVCLEATRFFDPTSTVRFGGAAREAVGFATGLAERTEHEVSMVLASVDPRPPERFGEIQAFFDHRYASRRRRFPWVRWQRLRPSLLWEVPGAGVRRLAERWRGTGPAGSSLYRHLDADVVLVQGVNYVSEHVVRERQGRPGRTVLRLIADTDLAASYLDPDGAPGPYDEAAETGRYLLAHADCVSTQTELQQRLLRERFGREGVLVRQPVDIAPLDEPDDPAGRRHVLWIGRADRVHKMPERCFVLAERLPDVPFVMVMNDEQRSLWRELVARAPKNVRIVRFVPPDEIGAHYRRAAAFVSTSRFEGFANTYTEAAVHRVPYLSYEVDPGGVVGLHGAGFCAGGDADALARELRAAIERRAPWPDRIEKAERYVRENHAMDVCVADLERLLVGLGSGEARSGS